jgi:hypothetical protein
MNATHGPSQHNGFDFRDLPDELIYLAVGVIAAVVFVAHLVLKRHPLLGASAVVAVTALAYVLAAARARLLDRRAARLDPPSPGVIVGTVKGDWKLPRERPFRVPWHAFHQHVLVAGPTGRGKTFTGALALGLPASTFGHAQASARSGSSDSSRPSAKGYDAAPGTSTPIRRGPRLDRLTPTSPIVLRRRADRAIVDRCQASPVFRFDW